MEEKATTPYPECTENVIVLVCEPSTEYGRPIVYQGTTISNALKDYYSFTTNREKVDVLKWIVAQPDFTELKRLSLAENKIFTLYTNQYDELLKTGEIPNNLQIAQKFANNGYDVFLLPNPSQTISADFIVQKKTCLYYIEAKTLNGKNSLDNRLDKGSHQSDFIAVNIIGTNSARYIATTVKNAFINNQQIKCLFLFKSSRMVVINSKVATSQNFWKDFLRDWNKQK
ncbi:MAG: hypothetical protein J6Y55_10570 [Bacteroidales bacterium]|nr:hypothetical protein [Bacteroidales bacterium]